MPTHADLPVYLTWVTVEQRMQKDGSSPGETNPLGTAAVTCVAGLKLLPLRAPLLSGPPLGNCTSSRYGGLSLCTSL